MDDDLHWRIAVHESGHAVCARLLGLPSGAASICALMAGAVAEGVVLGGYDSVALREDWRRATERLRRLGYDDGGAMLWGWTIDLLREHEDLIVRLATELWRASWLDQAEIDALLAE